MENISFNVLISFVLILLTLAHSFHDDKIVSLPGQPPVNFDQYAGYVSVHHDRSYFYYFVEAESKDVPLILWLNGGPGASSVGAGAFVEHGPFKVSGDHLIKNDYSWNKEANMLYLESPAGVGYSFSANKSFYNYVDDEITAKDNIVFLQQWLNKFPQYINSDFYIFGESYGGHYVPQLAHKLLKSKVKLNLKGISIGNPLLEFNTDFNSRAVYLWSHGVISDAQFELFNRVCNYSEIRRQFSRGNLSRSCYHVFHQSFLEIGNFINYYDVTQDVCLSPFHSQSATLSNFQGASKIDVCLDDETYVYLNREDVRKALHAGLVNVEKWSVFSSVLHYNMQNLELSMMDLLASLIKSGIRVLAYSGDQDSVVPLVGTRLVIHKLAKELGLNTTVPYSCWLAGEEVGGWTQAYGDILSFATVKGASHETSYSQPEISLLLFTSFIKGQN